MTSEARECNWAPTLSDMENAIYERDAIAAENARLRAACRAAADLLLRCDAEQRPNDLPTATDDDWDAVVAQLNEAIKHAEEHHDE